MLSDHKADRLDALEKAKAAEKEARAAVDAKNRALDERDELQVKLADAVNHSQAAELEAATDKVKKLKAKVKEQKTTVSLIQQ